MLKNSSTPLFKPKKNISTREATLKHIIYAGILSLPLIGASAEEILASYDFDATAADASLTTIVSPSVTASPLTSPMAIDFGTSYGDNSGLSAENNAFGDPSVLGAVAIQVSDATKRSFEDAVVADNYLSFTVTPENGISLNLSQLSFKVILRSDQGVDEYGLATAEGHLIGNANQITTIGSLTSTYEGVVIDLSASEFQNITEPTEFRIYAWGREDDRTAGTTAGFDKIVLKGTVENTMLVGYDFDGDSADLSDPSFVSDSVTAGQFSSAMDITFTPTIGDTSGLDAFGLELGDPSNLGAIGIDVNDAATASFEAAVNANDYLSFTVTPDNGLGLQLTHLAFKVAKEHADSVDEFALADATGKIIGSSAAVNTVTGTTGTYQEVVFNLLASSLEHIRETTEFRIYAWGRGSGQTAGTLSAIDKVALYGTPLTLGADYYVSATGNDSNTGTIDSPLSSIQHAVNQLGPGSTLYLRGGTYHQVIDLAGISSNEGFPITLKPYNGEDVTLDGTVEIIPTWELDEGNVYKATVPHDVTQLFIDDRLMTLARHPNALAFSEDAWRGRMLEQEPASSNGTVVDTALINQGVSYNDCVALLTLGAHVTYARLVENHTAGGDRFNYDPISTYKTTDIYHFEGGLNNADRILLDSAEEWSYDESTNTLYLWADNGQDPSGRKCFIKDKIYTLTGDAQTRNVIIDGFNFFASAFHFKSSDEITIQNCHFEYQASSRRSLGDTVRPLTAHFEGVDSDFCHNITVFNCQFERSDGAALWANYMENMRVENNLFREIDYACVSPNRNDPEVGLNQTQAAIVIENARDLLYRRNTLSTSGSGQGIITTLYDPFEGRPTTYEYNFHTDCARREQDGAAFQTPLEQIVGCVARHNWSLDNWQRDFRWDGDNAPLRGVHANFYRNVCMSNRKKSVAVSDGAHLKGDYHENYNNTGIYNWSGLAIGTANGSNAHTISRNNAADLFEDAGGLPVGIESHNFASSENPISMRTLLRDPDNHDFRPRAGKTDENGVEYLIDQGVPVSATREQLFNFVDLTNTNLLETIDVTEGYHGLAPDLGAYEHGDSTYWLPGRQREQASMPVPRRNGEYVVLDTDLMYLIGLGGESAHVYLGTSPNSLDYLTSKNAPENIVTLSDFTSLEGNTVYYWRVDTVLDDGSVVPGELWSFRTVVKREFIPLSVKSYNGASWELNGTGTAYHYDNSGPNFTNNALLYSNSTYQSDEGLRLTISYVTGTTDNSAGHNFSFGLISDETDLSSYNGARLNPFNANSNVYSIGANLVANDGVRNQGLNFTDGTAIHILDTAGDQVPFGSFEPFEENENNVVILEVLPNGRWNYSINGTQEASGTFAELGLADFDLSQNYHVAIYGQDDHGSGKTIQHVSIEEISPELSEYDAWIHSFIQQTGLQDEDPDGDGISNLMEYVLNGNPLVPDSEILPCIEDHEGQLVFRFNRRTESTSDTHQFVQLSTDLENWGGDIPLVENSSSSAISIEDHGDSTQSVGVTLDQTLEEEGKTFYRLKVTQE